MILCPAQLKKLFINSDKLCRTSAPKNLSVVSSWLLRGRKMSIFIPAWVMDAGVVLGRQQHCWKVQLVCFSSASPYVVQPAVSQTWTLLQASQVQQKPQPGLTAHFDSLFSAGLHHTVNSLEVPSSNYAICFSFPPFWACVSFRWSQASSDRGHVTTVVSASTVLSHLHEV